MDARWYKTANIKTSLLWYGGRWEVHIIMFFEYIYLYQATTFSAPHHLLVCLHSLALSLDPPRNDSMGEFHSRNTRCIVSQISDINAFKLIAVIHTTAISACWHQICNDISTSWWIMFTMQRLQFPHFDECQRVFNQIALRLFIIASSDKSYSPWWHGSGCAAFLLTVRAKLTASLYSPIVE